MTLVIIVIESNGRCSQEPRPAAIRRASHSTYDFGRTVAPARQKSIFGSLGMDWAASFSKSKDYTKIYIRSLLL
jgi:hypothetical protein